MDATSEKILNQTILDVDKTKATVTLTSNYIVVESVSKQKSAYNIPEPLDVKFSLKQCQVIPMEEVIAIREHVPTSPTKDKCPIMTSGIYGEAMKVLVSSLQCNQVEQYKLQHGARYQPVQSVELQPLSLAFDVCIIKRASKDRWRHKVVTFTCEDQKTCGQWLEKLNDVLSTHANNRPKKLLVFVNPYGGKKKAPKVFEKVRPIFEMASVTVEPVIETERQYHARDILQEYDLSDVDGVVCVGGDGTFSEVLNGLLDRFNKDEGVKQTYRHQPARPTLRIGVIPAGSTDTVVCSTLGTCDPITSALRIVLGDSIGIDVNALYNYKEEQFVKYSVTMTSYGYYGDLLADSERFRWMGPGRYKFSGFKKIVLNKAYEGEVSFLPAEESNGNPKDGTGCYSGCEICQRAGRELEASHRVMSKSASAPVLGSIKKDGWQRIRGKFVAIISVNVSCRCALSPEGISPYTHLGDGCMDLILVSNCSRFDYIRHLASIPSQGVNQFNFSFVQVFRVREFRFRPTNDPEEEISEHREMDTLSRSQSMDAEESPEHRNLDRRTDPLSRSQSMDEEAAGKTKDSIKSLKRSSSKHSVWNCDGEVIPHPHLEIQVHCQLVQLFARGVEKDTTVQQPEKCPICDNACTRF